MNSSSTNVVLFGECMVELRQASDNLMRQSFSGDTLNTAVYLSRLAAGAYGVHYATAVGDGDAFSNAMIASWQAEGIATGYVSQRAGELPGIYTIQVDAAGERTFSYWRQNSAARQYFSDAVSPLERDSAAIGVFYFSGISLAILPPEGRQRLLALLHTLRGQGTRIVFDNNYRPRLWSSTGVARDTYRQAYALADIALVTLSDDMEMAGDSTPHDANPDAGSEAALERVLAYPCPELVIKRGALPTLLRLAGGERIEVATEAVPRVVDTTAAGDSFGAGYLAARLHGAPPEAAARAGNRLAAAVIQHPGAIIAPSQMPDMPGFSA
jgi:2-dehydro-3-deoxygluconokinase